MKNNKGFIGILIAIIIALGIAGVTYYAVEKNKTQPPQDKVNYYNETDENNSLDLNVNTSLSATAKLDSYKIIKPKLYVYGYNLSAVKIFGVPTGTGVVTATVLGNATLQGTDSTGMQTWEFQPKEESLLLTSISIKGYGKTGAETGTIALPFSGASSIYGAFY